MSSNKHTKIKERLVLAQRVATTSIEMPPCGRCERKQRNGEKIKCIVSNNSWWCGECVHSNAQGCDVSSPLTAEWEKLKKEEEKLNAEARVTCETVATAMAQLNQLEA